MRAESRRVEPGLIEISLVNDGELDISSRPAVEVRGGRRLTAGDGLRGFELVEVDASTARLQAKPGTACRQEQGRSSAGCA